MLKSPVSSRDRSTEPRDVDRLPHEADPIDEVLAFLEPLKGLPDAPAGNGNGTGEAATDAVISDLTDEVVSDPEAIGLLLLGSRALGTASADSNYDFACVVTQDAYERRRQRRTAVERRFHANAPPVEITYESVGRLKRAARAGSTRGAAIATSSVLVDKTGEVEALRDGLAGAEAQVRNSVADEYDRYIHGFAHSLKSVSRGDDLGARAHAAQSGLHLVRALFALEGRRAPYLDQLSMRLKELDEPQGWRPGFLQGALHRLFYAPDPPFQQMLERRVGKLMESRDVHHAWRHDLDRLRTVSYDDL